MNKNQKRYWSPIQPQDQFNQTLENRVHPENWESPEPRKIYNLVVIGAGTAGLVTAAVAAGLGARVAIIERERLGGDCLNVGCVPSKGIIAAARNLYHVRKSNEFGIHLSGDPTINFSQVMERMRKLRSEISDDDSAQRFQSLGVDVFLGHAHFINYRSISVDGKTLHFKKAVIATGARASAPSFPGLDQVSYLTNENLFSLTELPEKFGIVGGGPIGAEMAQTFARFGSQVVLFEKSENILNREEKDAALVVQNSLVHDGVDIRTKVNELKFKPQGSRIEYFHSIDGDSKSGQVDKLLIAVGRAPNVEDLGLENAGVEYDLKNGIAVNDKLQTSNSNIYAAGDVCSRYKFTHSADFMARTVIVNALFFGKSRLSKLVIPWATYTDPELAHVGLYPQDAEQSGIEVSSITRHFSEVHRSILDGEVEGFVRVHHKKGSDKILGATVVGKHAGDFISHLTMAMTHNIGLKKLAATIHPYPTQGEAIRQLGDLYKKSAATPRVLGILKKFFEWRLK